MFLMRDQIAVALMLAAFIGAMLLMTWLWKRQ